MADHFVQTIAFEPDPDCFECLEKTKSHLNAGGGLLFNIALSCENKAGSLYPSKSNKGDGRIYDPIDGERLVGLPIQIRSFDSIAQANDLNMEFVFLKLDVQGSEYVVLQGMQNLFKRAKDVILWMEIQRANLEAAGHSVDSLLLLLKNLGFRPVNFDENFVEISWNDRIMDLKNKKNFCFRLRSMSA